jgi:FMN reductase
MDDLSGISVGPELFPPVGRRRAGGVVILSGAPATRSPSGVLTGYVAEHLERAGHRPVTITVRELPTVALLTADRGNPGTQHAAIRAAATVITQATAVVVVTPVYRAAHSGLVKALLDLLPRGTLAGKIVFPLATGGTQGQTFALDYVLRPLLQAIGATRVLPGHFLLDHHVRAATDTVTPTATPSLDTALTHLTDLLDPTPLASAS